jgi:hypothetical protein
MQSWEFALLTWQPGRTAVGFTHHETWRALAGEEFWDVMRRLGDDGWELVSAIEEQTAERSLYWFKRARQ